jgi:PAS domain S-box-containing protein
LIDGSQDKDRPVQRSRANGLLIAVLAAAALVLSVYCLAHAPDPAMVARWWPATTLTTVMLILAPRQARELAGLAAVIVLAASLYAGLGIAFALGFAIANAVEALLVLRWLTGFDVDRPQLRSWTDFRRWLIGLTVASAAAGAITAMTIGITGGEELWRPLLWITITHLGAQMAVLPLVMGHPRQRVKVSVLEVVSHLGLVGLCAYACFEADQSEPVGFLLLPLLMWGAARFTQRWANVELLGVTLGIAVLTAIGRGPFTEVTAQASGLAISASAQTFVAVSAVTSVAFSVAMAHLRDSLRRIRENELQLGQLVDSASGTAFIATDPDGLITWFSPGAEQLLGYTGEEVVGRITPIPFHEGRELLQRADELGIPSGYGVLIAELSLGADQDTRDWTFVRKDGSRLTVSVSVTAAHDEEGQTSSYLSVVRDVTDRRAAEQALLFALDKERETNKRMLELDRAKGEFVSAVSHELRTPLTSIVGYTELLTDDHANLTAMQQQLIERIERNGERLLHLVEDLLTLARVEDGSLSLDRVPTDLRHAVRSATDEVSHSAHKGRVSLRVHLPPEPVVLEGDAAYLERLVLNLVSNAVKFTPEGGSVDVDVSAGPEVAQLRVKDTGMGIPLAEQSRLFQRFFRSTLATEHAIQGTGLGLHIVRSIAEAHEGSADFESTPGVGTTFRILLPMPDPANDVPESLQDDESQERDGSTDGEPAELR